MLRMKVISYIVMSCALLLVAGLGIHACSPSAGGPRTSVVLISIDTCRADYLGCYGKNPSPTPHLDQLAGQAILYEEVVSPAPITLPAHCTLMTGRTPLGHRVHDNMTYRLAEEQVTLAERLREAGYATGAVVGAYVLDAQFGLSQGFDHYDDRFASSGPTGVTELNQRTADEVTARACDWIDQNAGQPFFLFVHYYDPHAPYAPPPPFAERYAEDPYAGEIAHTDAAIGRLLDHLRQHGTFDETLILVVADHGEGLGDHGEKGHGYFIYQSTLRVPLIVKPPRSEPGERITERVGLIDVMPTVLGALDLEPTGTMDGEDLGRSRTDAKAQRATRGFYAESLAPTTYGASPLLGWVQDGWKLIETSRPELYRLTDDPREGEDQIVTHAARAALLRAELETTLADQPAAVGEDERRSRLDDQTQERLQSLGYISGRRVTEDFSFDRSRPDAKDLIGYHEALQAALEKLGQRAYDEARALCVEMERQHPEIPDVQILLGDIACEQGRLEQAAAHYETYLDRDANRTAEATPSQGRLSNRYKAHYDLGNVLASLGKGAEAIEHYKAALRLEPDHLGASHNIGLTLAEMGRVDEAVPWLRNALRIKPRYTPALMDLAQANLLLRKPQDALACYDRVLEVDAAHVEALIRSGDLLQKLGRADAAIRRYARAIRTGPVPPQVHLRLARVLLIRGEAEEAVAAYRRGMRSAPPGGGLARELAWVLATHVDADVRDGREAVRIGEQLRRGSDQEDPAVLEILAAGYAEMGEFEQAVRWEKRALDRLQQVDGAEDTSAIRSRLDLYESRRPLRYKFASEGTSS